MQRLVEYRYQKALHHRLMKAADHSMLDIDVLVLIYHVAKVSHAPFLRSGLFSAPRPSWPPWACGIWERRGRSSASNQEAGSGITGWPQKTSFEISKGIWCA